MKTKNTIPTYQNRVESALWLGQLFPHFKQPEIKETSNPLTVPLNVRTLSKRIEAFPKVESPNAASPKSLRVKGECKDNKYQPSKRKWRRNENTKRKELGRQIEWTLEWCKEKKRWMKRKD